LGAATRAAFQDLRGVAARRRGGTAGWRHGGVAARRRGGALAPASGGPLPGAASRTERERTERERTLMPMEKTKRRGGRSDSKGALAVPSGAKSPKANGAKPRISRPDTLYERLGGKAAVAAVIEAFYQRVLADAALKPFFDGVEMRRLKSQQVDFFVQALGGPAIYRGPGMRQAHAHLAIEQRHFERVAEHLAATLRALGADDDSVQEVLQLVGPLASDIATSKSVSPTQKRKEIIVATKTLGSPRTGTGEATALTGTLEGIKALVEALQTNVFVADNDLNLIYMNGRAEQTLRQIEPEMDKAFGVRVGDLLGGSIHRFHRDPRHVERVLRDPRSLPHHAEFQFGDITLRTDINAVTAASGEALGYVVNWENVSEQRRQESELAKIRAMLESSPINTILANTELEIVYMNPASLRTLRGLEGHLPVKADSIVGQSVDIFHKNPAHQRRLLADPKNLPHRATIDVGPEKLELLVSAIHDNKGNYVGPMVTWEVITEKLRLEQEAARVHSMMENSPINTMYADRDLVIRYMNPASTRTLKTLQQHLPVPVEKMIGQSVDVFHKNPAHQRGILSDPKNLPRNAEIQVGPEILDLLVSAIYDNKGEYVGAMVTWEIITAKKAQLRKDAEFKGQIEAISRAQAVIEFKLDGTIATANDNFLNAMGYRMEEIQGRHHSMFVEESFRNSSEYRQFWEKLGNGQFQQAEYKRIAKAGNEVWLQAVYNPIFDENGKPVKVIKFATDITEQKNAAERLRHNVELMLNVVGKAMDGDLTVVVPVKGTDAIGQMGEGLQAFLQNLRGILTRFTETAHSMGSSSEQLTSVSQQMAGNAEETSAQANAVSAASEQVSKNIQVVAASSEEMVASIREIAKNSGDAARIAREAVGVAESANTTIKKLGESSTDIGKVIKVITSIAEQTNLLALNATIEAARAGEAGKGFAVVANEVKELAKQTAHATEDIGRRIEAIQGDTTQAVDATEEVGKIIGQISEISSTIAAAVEQQTATTNEIGRNVSEAARGSGEISQNITGVATAAADTTKGASETQQAAAALSQMASRLQELVAQFKV
jgi:methyl-accepting chemotaxis protein